jgi:GTP cyclohydrolase I
LRLLLFRFNQKESSMDQETREYNVRAFLEEIGDDPRREGIEETPARYLKAWDFWSSGYRMDPGAVLKTFEDGAEGVDEIVVQTNVPIYSHCEHHLAPFWGVAHIGYIPQGRVVGLSKFKRLVDCFALRLQVQERLTQQIATAFHEIIKPQATGVILQCRHMCMESRGIRTAGSTTMTSSLLGSFHDDRAARSEFLQLVRMASDGKAG